MVKQKIEDLVLVMDKKLIRIMIRKKGIVITPVNPEDELSLHESHYLTFVQNEYIGSRIKGEEINCNVIFNRAFIRYRSYHINSLGGKK